MSEPIEINGRRATYEKMGLRQQMKLWPTLAKDLGPVIGQLKAMQGKDFNDPDVQVSVMCDMLEKAGGVLEHAELYLDAFVKQTQVDVSPIAKGLQPLAAFEEQVFTSPTHVIEFVIKCMQIEFGDFLAELLEKTEPAQSESAESPSPKS